MIFENSIIPEGYYELDEENRKLLKKEDFNIDLDKIEDKEYWVYKYPKILINGDINFDQCKIENIKEELEEKYINENSLALRNISIE